MEEKRLIAAALAAVGAASAMPIPLAQLDFAGVIDVFDIDAGDTTDALQAVAAIGGVLTCLVIALAWVGAILAATGGRHARAVLLAAAIAGVATAMPLWLPAGVVIGAAATVVSRAP